MITVTESAKTKILDLLAEEGNPDLFLRTFVQGGGCSGMSYGFTFDEVMNEDDFEMPLPQSKILIDAMSMQYLTGATVDSKVHSLSSPIQTLSQHAVVAAVLAFKGTYGIIRLHIKDSCFGKSIK